MKSSFRCRILMMDASYKAYFHANDHVKKYLAEGIFWLADTVEEEIRIQKPMNLDYCIANVSDIKRIAEESFKDPNRWVGTDKFTIATHRLSIGLPD